jgi:hypothetical protein
VNPDQLPSNCLKASIQKINFFICVLIIDKIIISFNKFIIAKSCAYLGVCSPADQPFLPSPEVERGGKN